MKIVKRDGHIVDYNPNKIKTAISKANTEVRDNEKASEKDIEKIIKYIEDLNKKRILVEDIQDIIEEKLMEIGKFSLAKKYITYRYTRELVRKSNTTDQSIKELIEGENEIYGNEKPIIVTAQRDYLAGITSTDITRRFLLSDDVAKAHDEGIIHFHDTEYFAQNALNNCELINLDDMLQNGTVINGVEIERPHRFLTAAVVSSQIIYTVTSSSYGGATISLAHLAPFVRLSFEKNYAMYKELGLEDIDCKRLAEVDTKNEIADGVEIFNYQVSSLVNSSPKESIVSLNMYFGETEEYKDELAMIIEEFFNQRILYNTHAFPKLLYVLEEDNINENSKYWYLTELAAKCTAIGLNIEYISEKKMKELKKNKNGEGDCYPYMGNNNILTPDRFTNLGNIANAKNYRTGKGKYYGRFNQGIVTINLPDVALSSEKDIENFWNILDERLELCHKALQIRHKRLSNVKSDVAPILWQHGALARLKDGESIHELLHHGYSTISLGYAGLYETVKYMTGKSNVDGGEGEKFAIEIVQKLNDTCNRWKLDEDLDYLVYGAIDKATLNKFSRCLKEKFGIIEGITDKDCISNSYEFPEKEIMDENLKLKIESKFQKFTPGGFVSYLELKETDSILEKIRYVYENLMFAELIIS